MSMRQYLGGADAMRSPVNIEQVSEEQHLTHCFIMRLERDDARALADEEQSINVPPQAN